MFLVIYISFIDTRHVYFGSFFKLINVLLHFLYTKYDSDFWHLDLFACKYVAYNIAKKYLREKVNP